MKKEHYFYFDIETAGAYKNLEEMKANDPRQYELFRWKKNFKSETDDSWKGDDEEVYSKKAALLPEFGRIVCISWAFYKSDGELKIGSIINKDEKQMITEAKKMFDQVSQLKLAPCGYNIKGFDIPVLFKMFIKYGLTPSPCLSFYNKKPWDVDMLDLQEFWKNGSNSMSCTLDEMSYMLGVDSPKDEMHGYEVKEAWDNGRYSDIKRYCEKDVKCTVDIVEKLEIMDF